MKTIVFATNNSNKIREVQQLLGNQYSFLSLKDINCLEEVPETTGTIEGNARQKATYVRDNYQRDCFSEDTGLEVMALDGRPGVDTAFYAGPERNAVANMQKVLDELVEQSERQARFRTVVALWLDGELHTFEGIVNGTIAREMSGADGFGYDPIFIPEGHNVSFAEMSSAEKNAISHRARAIAKLQRFLQDYKVSTSK